MIELAKWLWGVLIMRRLPDGFCRALSTFGMIEGACLADSEFANEELSPSTINIITQSLDLLNEACVVLGADMTMRASARLASRLDGKNPISVKDAVTALEEVRRRFFDELNERTLMGIGPAETLLCASPHKLFGETVCERFGSEDLEEASYCLSLGRNTASVFHLMRAMEGAVKLLGTKLGVQNIDKEWGKILSDIAGKIEDMPKGDQRDEWSECHVNLYHVKQAWRNRTMHPKRTYTAEQAQDVFKAVKTFLIQLERLL